MSYTAMEHMGVVLQFVIHHQVSHCPICIPFALSPFPGCAWGVHIIYRSTKFWQERVDCCAVVQYKNTMLVGICPVPNGKY